MPNGLKLSYYALPLYVESINHPTKIKTKPLNSVTSLKSISTKLNQKERALFDCRWARTCSPKIGLWLPRPYPFDADQKDNLSDNSFYCNICNREALKKTLN